MTRKQRLVAASIVVALFSLWAIVSFWVGPAEIARAHRGESLPFVNDILSARDTSPLEEYLAHWARVTTKLGWLLLGAVVVVYGSAELLTSGAGRRVRRTAGERFRGWATAARSKNPVSDLRLSDGLLLSAAIGLATGAAEGFVQFLRRFVLGDLDFLMGPVGPEVVWLVPAVSGLVFLVAGGSLSVLMRYVWPGNLRTSYLLLPLVTLSLFTLSRALLPRLAWWAVALLAVGVATRVAYSSRSVARRSTKRIATLGVAALLVAEAATAVALNLSEGQDRTAVSAADDPPNVLLIILDTVRAANLGLYGYHRPTTPVLDSLSERAITFDMAFVPAPWTLPSHASFFTGRQPYELKLDWLTPLNDTFPTVAEWFSDHGYATGGFVANLDVCGRQYRLDRGFGRYEAAPVSWRTALSNTWITRSLIKTARWRLGYHRLFLRKSAAEVNRSFLAWQADTDRPFFAFLNYFDAHDPYGPPEDWPHEFSAPGDRYWFVKGGRFDTEEDLKQLTNSYDDGIHYIDAQIGALLDSLSQRGTLENTLVVITSDHGEEFKEHGRLGHGVTLFRQVLHVPLLIIPPGDPDNGVRVTSPVGLSRLAATLVEMAGIGDGSPFPGLPLASSDATPAGHSLPILSESTAKPGATVGEAYSIVDRGYHYIVGDGRDELYDLEADPGEMNDLSSEAEMQIVIASMQDVFEQLVNGAGQ